MAKPTAHPPLWIENFKPERHNLFLSHAGEDKSFVRLLHEDLKKRHHSPFLDKEPDSLPLGSYYPETIYESLRRSQVIVFVLSRHFVTKKWPMLELVAVWKMPERERPIIFPVFYKLDVNEIREPLLSQWEQGWKVDAAKDPDVDPSACRKALRFLTKLSGVLKHPATMDYDFAKTVVFAICKRVTPNKFLVNEAMQKEVEFCGEIRSNMEEIRGQCKCTMLGMWGGTGTGKTWIAMALCRYFYKEYCGWVCMVDLSRKKDKLAVVKAMYFGFTGEELGKTIDTDEVALDKLRELVQGKAFFLVVENVSLTQDYKSTMDVVIDLLQHCKEGRVLVTAREEKLLTSLLQSVGNGCATNVVEVPSLDEDGAIHLLLSLACPDRTWERLDAAEQEAVQEVCKTVLEAVNFHPLLTKVLGMQIAQSDKKSKPLTWPAWAEADENLKKDFDSKMLVLLTEQFQSMTANHLQSFYIDAALYDVAIETGLDGICRWLSIIYGCRPETVLRKLRQVAKHGFLSWEEECDDDDDSEAEDPEIITDETFAEFATQKVLENPEEWGWFFYNGIAEEEAAISAAGSDDDDDEGEEERSFAAPRPKDVKKIEKIALMGGKFADVGEVLNLTRYTKAIALVLSRCDEVEELNVEWNTHLKVLEVEDCEKLQEIEGLEDLVELVCLRVVDAPSWPSNAGSGDADAADDGELDFQKPWRLPRLECIKVEDAASEQAMAELDFQRLRRLQRLEIRNTALQMLPSIRGCSKLRELAIEDNDNLRSLPPLWSGFPRLRKISFSCCENLTALPDLSPLARTLTTLDISFCEKLASAACISRLTSLEKLSLDGCVALSPLPDITRLACLRRISASSLVPSVVKAWLGAMASAGVAGLRNQVLESYSHDPDLVKMLDDDDDSSINDGIDDGEEEEDDEDDDGDGEVEYDGDDVGNTNYGDDGSDWWKERRRW